MHLSEFFLMIAYQLFLSFNLNQIVFLLILSTATSFSLHLGVVMDVIFVHLFELQHVGLIHL